MSETLDGLDANLHDEVEGCGRGGAEPQSLAEEAFPQGHAIDHEDVFHDVGGDGPGGAKPQAAVHETGVKAQRRGHGDDAEVPCRVEGRSAGGAKAKKPAEESMSKGLDGLDANLHVGMARENERQCCTEGDAAAAPSSSDVQGEALIFKKVEEQCCRREGHATCAA